MSKNKQSLFLKIALMLCTLFFMLAVTFVTHSVATKAESTDTNYFKMQYGASIRMFDSTKDDGEWTDGNGIKFETIVGQDYYDNLVKNNTGATIEFGMLLTISDVADITTLTYDCNDSNKKIYPCRVAPTFTNGTFTYTQTIVDVPSSFYSTAITARGYAKITKDNDSTYVYATANDNVRSMRGVAVVAYQNGCDVENYLYDNVAKSSTYVELADIAVNDTVALPSGMAATDVKEVYLGSKKLNVSVTESGVTVPTAGIAYGESYNVAFVGEDSVSIVTAKRVTKVIKTASDLTALSLTYSTANLPTLDGYFVLADNIDASSYTHSHSGNQFNPSTSSDYGFKGVFDGQGYTIDGMTLNYNGLFLKVGSGATIKNVAFINTKFNYSGNSNTRDRAVIFANHIHGTSTEKVTIENVYIQLDTLTTEGKTWNYETFAAPMAWQVQNTTFSNVVIDYNEDLSTKMPASQGCQYGSFVANQNVTGVTATNTYVVSPMKLQNKQSDGTSVEATLVNLGVVRYDNTQLFKAASIATTDFKDYWEIKDGIPVWKNLPKATTPLKEKFYADNNSAIITLPETVTAVNSVSMNGENVTNYTFSNRTLTVSASVYAGVELGENCSFDIDTGDTLYRATAKRVTKVIKTASDLTALSLTYSTANLPTLDGYFVLADNIDASSYTHSHSGNQFNPSTSSDYGFKGVFDGQGYTIDGMTLNYNGLFLKVGSGATIKNVAFINTKFNYSGNSNTRDRAVIFANHIHGTSTEKVTIENVYIQLDTLTTEGKTWNYETFAAPMAWQVQNTTFSNVVIDYNEDLSTKMPASQGCQYGSFVANQNVTGVTATNTYVVSPMKLQNKQSDGSSVEETLVNLGVVRCDNTEAFISAMEDTEKLNAFDNEYWDITGGTPVWKTVETE